MFRPEARTSGRARSAKCVAAALAVASVAGACEPKLTVGTWNCPAPARSADGGVLPMDTDPLPVPWSTSFETGLCDWDRASGFCYGDPHAEFEVVSSPTHSGDKALAFTVTPGDMNGRQARCVREGALPTEAIYGAWFYVPELATNTGNWNLMHFQGSVPPAMPANWWDVSLVNDTGGGLVPQVLNYVGQSPLKPLVYKSATEIVAARWFHLEFHWLRASDTTGEFWLLQDGQQVAHEAGIATDDADWGQWYVGNLATGLDQPDSTVYVDDVSIRLP